MYTIPTLIILIIIYFVYIHKQKSKGVIPYYEADRKEIICVLVCTMIFFIMVIGRLAYTKFHGTYHPCEGCRFQPVVKIFYNADGKRIEEKDIVFKKCVNLPFYKF
jgi:hypothetical protein